MYIPKYNRSVSDKIKPNILNHFSKDFFTINYVCNIKVIIIVLRTLL